uniref:Uncharacterized protein n=1 Tax=Hyaloperonospora arabidopsidis (strain Emoy2) TaxID=559515 RepID=M4BX52_HYAAE
MQWYGPLEISFPKTYSAFCSPPLCQQFLLCCDDVSSAVPLPAMRSHAAESFDTLCCLRVGDGCEVCYIKGEYQDKVSYLPVQYLPEAAYKLQEMQGDFLSELDEAKATDTSFYAFQVLVHDSPSNATPSNSTGAVDQAGYAKQRIKKASFAATCN